MPEPVPPIRERAGAPKRLLVVGFSLAVLLALAAVLVRPGDRPRPVLIGDRGPAVAPGGFVWHRQIAPRVALAWLTAEPAGSGVEPGRRPHRRSDKEGHKPNVRPTPHRAARTRGSRTAVAQAGASRAAVEQTDTPAVSPARSGSSSTDGDTRSSGVSSRASAAGLSHRSSGSGATPDSSTSDGSSKADVSPGSSTAGVSHASSPASKSSSAGTSASGSHAASGGSSANQLPAPGGPPPP